MPLYGATTINLALGLAVLTIVTMAIYLHSEDYRWFSAGQRLLLSVSFLVFLATITLLGNLMKGNFNVDYVAHYTSLKTPLLYKFTALWAGQAGSLLFLHCRHLLALSMQGISRRRLVLCWHGNGHRKEVLFGIFRSPRWLDSLLF